MSDANVILYTVAVLFVAYMVRGIAGFGSGLIAIPLLVLVHPLTVVVPLVVVLDFLEIMPLLPFTLIGVCAALLVFKNIELATLNFALAVFIIFFAIYQLLPLPQLHGSKLWAGPAGFLGGLVGTVFGTGGPFYMIYLNLRSLDKQQTRASFATYFFVDGSIRIMGFLLIGLLNFSVLKNLALWLPAAAFGLLLGGQVHAGISNKTFKVMISLILVFSGYRLLTS